MKKRIFIGIDISDESRKLISEYSGNLRNRFPLLKANWTRSENFHITLKFVGEIRGEKLKELTGPVSAIVRKFNPFLLRIDQNGVFPDIKKPKIIWIGIQENGERLGNLVNNVEIELERLGLKREARKFHPHITIARLRQPKFGSPIAKEHLNQKIDPVEFLVTEIIIYESQLNPTGSIYVPLKKMSI